MRAGENRGILSRVLTIYKQTFIFPIFHLFFFRKRELPPFPGPLELRPMGQCHSTKDTCWTWRALPFPSPTRGEGEQDHPSTSPQGQNEGREAAEQDVCCFCSERNPLGAVRVLGFTSPREPASEGWDGSPLGQTLAAQTHSLFGASQWQGMLLREISEAMEP